MTKKQNMRFIFLLFVCFFFFVGVFENNASADTATVDALKNKISEKNDQIKKLEEEISQFKTSLEKESAKASSLQREINSLNITKKSLETELKKTETNLQKTSLTIDKLGEEINSTSDTISNKTMTLSHLLRSVQHTDNLSTIEKTLSVESLEEFGEQQIQEESVSVKIADFVKELKTLKLELENKKGDAIDKKEDLSKFKKELSVKKQSVASVEATTGALLKDTKNKETEYQKILNEKVKQRAQFEAELFAIESELKFVLDPSKLPKGSVLLWPLDNIHITQNFGKTVESKRLYTSGSHNGLDLRASDGTAVKASLSGTVQATGNTDLKKGCYSYGKWILIKHTNGLSTLYAHLSAINVSAGTNVVTGDVIGLSGRTGYVTGPHLHLTVFVSDGVVVQPIPSGKSAKCAGVTIPLANPDAFLDPLTYLPK